MNQTTEEQLARWVAERLGDIDCCKDTYAMCAIMHGTADSRWDSYDAYLSDLNIAGRFREWYTSEVEVTTKNDLTGGMGLMFIAGKNLTQLQDFDRDVWDDTPSAILALAEACGFEVEG